MNTYRTFTPVPKQVQDGSEDVNVLPAAVLSGAPMELQARTVRYVQSSPWCPLCVKHAQQYFLVLGYGARRIKRKSNRN